MILHPMNLFIFSEESNDINIIKAFPTTMNPVQWSIETLVISTQILWLLFTVVAAEERLSWFTTQEDLRREIFVPDNLSEGKEEDRVLPLVFHSEDETKSVEMKCIMRGYNASNNPSDYKDARWSHQGFDDSQVDTSAGPEPGEEDGVDYRIWTIKVTISAADAGKKSVTCDFQQGDFPLSIELTFMVFKRLPFSQTENETMAMELSYGLGEQLDEEDEKYMTQQVVDDIKGRISGYYSMPASSVTRTEDGQEFRITVDKEQVLNPHDGDGGSSVWLILLVCLILIVLIALPIVFRSQILIIFNRWSQRSSQSHEPIGSSM